MTIEKLRRYINEQVVIEFQQNLFQAGGGSMRSEIHTIINSNRNKEEFPQQSKLVAH